jgi:spermidine synthase
MRAWSPYRLFFSIGALSAAIIAFQIALIQIVSIVQWYHFAYMVISIAMLGFGAAGTVLAIFGQKILSRSDRLLPPLMIATGITMALVTGISQWPFVRFDSYLLFADYSQIKNLLLTYLLFLIPFFLGALAIGLTFIKHVKDIGKIYFANLLGSGAGGILALVIIWFFLPERMPSIISILPVLSGIMILHDKQKLLNIGFAVIAAAICTWKIISPPHLVLSQFKDLSKALLLPESELTLEKNSPYGFIQAITSPVLRYAPGLSLTAQQTADVNTAVFTNADWFGVITEQPRGDTSMVLDYTTFALPYAMSPRESVLVLKAATGMDVTHALGRNAEKIIAVEPNEVIISALRKELAKANDSLFYNPKVSVHMLEPRTFLLRDTAHYDLIVLPVVGAFGGVGGLYALHEQYMLTKESFADMWYRLNDRGVISVTSWLDYPLRNPLKILSTLAELMEDLKIPDPDDHIAAVRSWGTITFLLSKSPLTQLDMRNARAFCEQMRFDPALLPDLKPEERSRYNQLQDDRLFRYMDQILSGDRNTLYENYDFNIRPATDNKPYFSQFLRWKSFQRLAAMLGNRSIPFLEIGYLLVIITLIQITIFSFVLILLPLFRLGWKGKNKGNIILYFGGIGLGFMFVEMVFIQRFILYLGNPVYAASAVITLLLIFSGIGSYNSGYFMQRRNGMVLILSLIVALLVAYSFILTPVLQQTVHLTLPLRIGIICALTVPLAFCMGCPFPTGLSHVSKINPAETPWAWGINGCISVISTALATIVAVEMGFTWVMWIAALAYCLPLMVAVRWKADRKAG